MTPPHALSHTQINPNVFDWHSSVVIVRKLQRVRNTYLCSLESSSKYCHQPCRQNGLCRWYQYRLLFWYRSKFKHKDATAIYLWRRFLSTSAWSISFSSRCEIGLGSCWTGFGAPRSPWPWYPSSICMRSSCITSAANRRGLGDYVLSILHWVLVRICIQLNNTFLWKTPV